MRTERWALALGATALLAAVALSMSGVQGAARVTSGPSDVRGAVAISGSATICAKEGLASVGTDTKQLSNVPIYGFVHGGCSGNPTAPTLGGLRLETTVGTSIALTLENALPEPVTLALPGLLGADAATGIVPDETGAAGYDGTYDATTYVFTATRPGTFLIQAGGPAARWQIPMGLVAVLIVRPDPATASGQAYADARTAFDAEATVVLSELDPALNTWVKGSGGSSFDFTRWAPTYWLLNGRTFGPGNTTLATGVAGKRLLLRYVNAGYSSHALELLGARQLVVGTDAFGPGATVPPPFEAVSVDVPAAGTVDVIVAVPATAGTALPNGLVLWDRGQAITDGARPARYPGGMMLYVTP